MVLVLVSILNLALVWILTLFKFSFISDQCKSVYSSGTMLKGSSFYPKFSFFFLE